jgi:hypothetical protein
MNSDLMNNIDAFWAWWQANSSRVEDEFQLGADATYIPELSERVSAIHQGLDWEFGPGTNARHCLCVSGVGDLRLRAIAERWRAAGQADEAFEFRSSRQRGPKAHEHTIRFGSTDFDVGELRIDVTPDESRQAFDIVVHHPAFAAMNEKLRTVALFITLDNLLGEDSVVTWIGTIDISLETPKDPINAEGLRDLIDAAVQRWPEPKWAVFEAEDPDSGQPVVLTACTSRKFLHAPLFDTLCLARLPYEPIDNGMPHPETFSAIRKMEDQVEEELGESAYLLASETGASLRSLFFYVRGIGAETRAIKEAIKPLGGRIEVHWDPGWKQIPV